MRYHRAIFTFALLLALTATAASAEVDLGLKGIGVRAGMVDAENLDATLAFGIFADLGTFHPNFSLETYVDYWSWSEDFAGLGETSFRDVKIGARGEYAFTLTTVRPFVGAGVSAHLLHSEATIADMNLGTITVPGMSLDASDTKVGFDVGGGLRAGLAERIDIVGEAWYSFVSDINQLGVTGGVLFKLP